MTVFNYFNKNNISSNYKNISISKFKESEFNTYYDAKDNKMIEVYIGGAVKNPGTYKVKKRTSIDKIIKKYINLNNNADLSKININRKLQHKDRLIIPNKGID
ncbi:MAG: SLBB domain-containing protein [Bacillota bacterium]